MEGVDVVLRAGWGTSARALARATEKLRLGPPTPLRIALLAIGQVRGLVTTTGEKGDRS